MAALELSKATKQRLASMDPEDALDELERLKDEHNAKRREYRLRNIERIRPKEREQGARARKNNPKGVKKYRHTYQEKVNADPKRREELLAQKRELTKLSRKYEGKTEASRASGRKWAKKHQAQKYALRSPEELRKRLAKQVPGYLIGSAKTDVVNSAFESILARKISIDDIDTCVKPFVTQHNRMFDYFKHVSFDAPIPGTDNLKRGDLISSDTFHF